MNDEWEVGDIVVLNEAGERYLLECKCPLDWVREFQQPGEVKNDKYRHLAIVISNGIWMSPYKKYFDLHLDFEREYV